MIPVTNPDFLQKYTPRPNTFGEKQVLFCKKYENVIKADARCVFRDIKEDNQLQQKSCNADKLVDASFAYDDIFTTTIENNSYDTSRFYDAIKLSKANDNKNNEISYPQF